MRNQRVQGSGTVCRGISKALVPLKKNCYVVGRVGGSGERGDLCEGTIEGAVLGGKHVISVKARISVENRSNRPLSTSQAYYARGLTVCYNKSSNT